MNKLNSLGVGLAKAAIGFIFSSVLYLAPDLGTLKVDNLFKLGKLIRGFSKAFHMPCVADRTSFGTLPSLESHQPKFRTIIDK